jgi:hypothetical protein
MTEGLPVLIKLLEVPFSPDGLKTTGYPGTNKSYDDYGPALSVLQYLGTDAAAFIPLLEIRLKEIENYNLGDAGVHLVRGFKIAIMHAKGELPRKRRYAVNGTGPLDEPSRQIEAVEAPPAPTAASGPIIVNYPKSEPAPKPLPAAPAHKDYNPVWWIVGLIIIAGGVMFVARKKKPRA